MEKNSGRKWTIVAFAFVCVAISGLTVAFANLSAQLNISPEATVKGNEWKIEFDNVVLNIPIGDATATPVDNLNIQATSISNMEIELNTPGDSVTYTFDVVNKGSIDAKIGDITIGTPTCTGQSLVPADATADAALVCGNITYTLLYSAGDINAGLAPTASNGALGKDGSTNDTRNMTLIITYGTGGTSVPTDDVLISGLDISITYVQD